MIGLVQHAENSHPIQRRPFSMLGPKETITFLPASSRRPSILMMRLREEDDCGPCWQETASGLSALFEQIVLPPPAASRLQTL